MKQMKLKKASAGKRVLSDIIDFFFSVVLFFVLYMFVIQPLYFNHTDYKKVYAKYGEALELTGFYDYNDKTLGVSVVALKEDGEVPNTSEDYYYFYDYRLVDFYTKNDQLDTYTQMKIDSKLFDDSGKILETVSPKVSKDFFVKAIDKATQDIFFKDEEHNKMIKEINSYSTQMVIFSFLPPFILFYFIMPLIFKDGQTLGKHFMNLRVASLNQGFNLPLGAMLLRQALVVFVGILGGVFTLGILPIAFILTYIFQKEGRSINDLLASTIVYENVIPDENTDDILLLEIRDDDLIKNPSNWVKNDQINDNNHPSVEELDKGEEEPNKAEEK